MRPTSETLRFAPARR